MSAAAATDGTDYIGQAIAGGVFRSICEAAASRFGVVPEVHPDDFIFRFLLGNTSFTDPDHAVHYYFEDAARSAERLRGLLYDRCGLSGGSFDLLEFAAGYGCLTRHLGSALPGCTVTSCDIHTNALVFLREHLGVPVLASNTVPERLVSERSFDAVFALSFFSHMPARTFTRWMRALASLVRPGGFLIFTTQGLVTRDKYWSNTRLDRQGFFFLPDSEQKDLAAAEYGTTLASPYYVFNAARSLGNLRPRMFEEGFWWTHQDVYVLQVSAPR